MHGGKLFAIVKSLVSGCERSQRHNPKEDHDYAIEMSDSQEEEKDTFDRTLLSGPACVLNYAPFHRS